jgi:hypothetical protein
MAGCFGFFTFSQFGDQLSLIQASEKPFARNKKTQRRSRGP